MSLPALFALVALLAGLAGSVGAWKVQEWRHAAMEKERIEAAAEERRIAAKRIDTAASGHEADKARIRTEFVTVTETVERIVREPFYAGPDAAACLDAGGLQSLTDAIRGAGAPGQPPPAVPRSGPAD